MKTQVKGDIVIVDIIFTTVENNIITTRARKAKTNKGVVVEIGDKVSLELSIGDTVLFDPIYLMPWFGNKRSIQGKFIKGVVKPIHRFSVDG